MGSVHRKYSYEQKLAAARAVVEGGKPVSEAIVYVKQVMNKRGWQTGLWNSTSRPPQSKRQPLP